MKILLIAPYRQCDGWGNQAKAYAHSLNQTSHDIVIRPVYFGGSLSDLTDEVLLGLEKKDSRDCDIVIQNVLPSSLCYDAHFKKNIGLVLTETKNWDYLSWPASLNLMDEIWVPSLQCVKNIDPQDPDTSGNVTKVSVNNIPSPLDTSVFDQSHEKLQGIDDSFFNFYYIGEFSQRKNLEALLIAFYSEFDSSESAGLVIKCHAGAEDAVRQLSSRVRETIGIHSNGEKEAVIAKWLSGEEMLSLHNTCDCFVFPSHGESCCRPALTAMGFGKTPIVTGGTGMCDFIDETTGWQIESYEDVVYCSDKPLPYLYTSRELWRMPVIKDMMKKMREAYENTSLRKQKARQGMNKIYDHSYENVGRKMEDLLCQVNP